MTPLAKGTPKEQLVHHLKGIVDSLMQQTESRKPDDDVIRQLREDYNNLQKMVRRQYEQNKAMMEMLQAQGEQLRLQGEHIQQLVTRTTTPSGVSFTTEEHEELLKENRKLKAFIASMYNPNAMPT